MLLDLINEYKNWLCHSSNVATFFWNNMSTISAIGYFYWIQIRILAIIRIWHIDFSFDLCSYAKFEVSIFGILISLLKFFVCILAKQSKHSYFSYFQHTFKLAFILILRKRKVCVANTNFIHAIFITKICIKLSYTIRSILNRLLNN